MKSSWLYSLIPFSLFGYAVAANQQPKPAAVNFSRDVKPILSQHCYKCHGPDVAKAAAGLRLDSFEGASKLLGDGAAVVPGTPDKSLLLKRVAATDKDMRMPPEGSGVTALTPEQVQILREWIASGAKYETHWSFIAPKMAAQPNVSDPRWCKNPIDRFVLAKLDASGLKPEPEADRDTLALRAAETLTGLAPSPKELEKFRNDKGRGAYERYVDRLLASPAYGENQARYWLDAVRYADTHGLHIDNERIIYPYRDWVVNAFNKDLPYNTFTEWQLAGDLLPKPTTEQLIATGYVRMNPTSNEGGAIEEEFLARNTMDRVDTTSTVFLGLTYGCAKCHDHKYDPIKQRDYYGLYAFFDSTQDKPLDGNEGLPAPVIRASTPAQEARLAELSHRVEQLSTNVRPADAEAWLATHHNPVPTTRDWQISPAYTSATFDEAFDKSSPGEPGQPVPTWKPFKYQPGKAVTGIIGKDNSAVYIRSTVTVPAARSMTIGVSSDDGVKVWVNGKLVHSHKVNRSVTEVDPVKIDLNAGDNELIAKVTNGAGEDGWNVKLADPNDQRIDNAIAAYKKAPTAVPAINELRSVFLDLGPATPEAAEYRKTVKARAGYEAAIPMTLIAREMDKPRPTFILKRGQYDLKGDPVDRHLPAILGTLPAGAPVDRLALAKWMTAPNNPLVSRVFVNRVWQQAFGTGLVKTSEDFGSQGEWPVNQELLDYLAVDFVKTGWSVKKLNRLIVTSAAFRQSSHTTVAKLNTDPENRLISRGPRFRLDAEIIRDKALEAGGLLLQYEGGRGFRPYQPDGLWEAVAFDISDTAKYMRDHDAGIYRRSLYLFWKRTSPHPVMLTFDAPMRESCVVRRSRTNTPLQALTTMNEPAFLEASRTMAQRLLGTAGSDESRLRDAYHLALSREPSAAESKVMLAALSRYRNQYTTNPTAAAGLLKIGDAPAAASENPAEEAAWMIVCSTLMNTDEFLTLH